MIDCHMTNDMYILQRNLNYQGLKMLVEKQEDLCLI